jgi:hypothetical protein
MQQSSSVPSTQQPQFTDAAALGDGESEVGMHPYAMSIATGSGSEREDTGVETGRSGSLATWHEEPAPPYRARESGLGT